MLVAVEKPRGAAINAPGAVAWLFRPGRTVPRFQRSDSNAWYESPTMTDWAAYPGPECYHPGEVELALTALARVSSERAARDAYNRLLSAVGNNHAGTL